MKVSVYKKDFPLFLHHPELIYFDSAATTQRPQEVVDALVRYYTQHNTNVHRTIYALGEHTSTQYELVRKQVADFIGARSEHEIIFTQGATDSLNLVALSWGVHNLTIGDEIVVTELEHHSNFVPWQRIAQKTGALLRIIPVAKSGELIIDPLENWITPATKLVALTHVSNVLGTTDKNFYALIRAAKAVGAKVVVDGAQAVGYIPVDVKKMGIDFYAFSAHKMFGPTGVGVLYVSQENYAQMIPSAFGGGAVFEVTSEVTSLLHPPRCYEAGTQPIAQVIGLGAAIQYIQKVGLQNIHTHTNALVNQFLTLVNDIPEIRIIGIVSELRKSAHLVTFVVAEMHAHDVAAYLDTHGICVRAGNHCAQLAARALGYDASVRVSFNIYNSAQEVDYFVKCLKKLVMH